MPRQQSTIAMQESATPTASDDDTLAVALRVARAGRWRWDMTGDAQGRAVGGAVTWSDPDTPDSITRGSWQDWLKTLPQDSALSIELALRKQLAQNSKELALEYQTTLAEGGRWIALRANVFLNTDGTPSRATGVLLDVSEKCRADVALRRLREELALHEDAAHAEQQRRRQLYADQQEMDSIVQLTGGVAHDFNNVLTVISSSLHLLHDADDQARRKVLVRRLEKAAQRGTELTQRLLAFARQQWLQPRPVDVADRIARLAMLVKNSLPEQITILTSAQAGLWPAMADDAALELALLNMVMNAREAMPNGGTIMLAARNATLCRDRAAMLEIAMGDYVEISVSDNGAGMAPDVLARVFEPFFTTSKIGEHSGLGLPQVYGFARQSGGNVRIDSHPGQGTTAVILLPRYDATINGLPARIQSGADADLKRSA